MPGLFSQPPSRVESTAMSVTVDRYLVGLGKVVDGADPAITIAAVEASPA
jgi:hypothetical protein